MSVDITPGAIMLHGLQSRDDLNGATGVVTKWNDKQSRWEVEVEGEPKKLALKLENLTAEPSESAERLSAQVEEMETMEEELSPARRTRPAAPFSAENSVYLKNLDHVVGVALSAVADDGAHLLAADAASRAKLERLRDASADELRQMKLLFCTLGDRFEQSRVNVNFFDNRPLEITLEPGDVLFVPRGMYHHTATPEGGEASLHVTIGVETDTDHFTWHALLADTAEAPSP